MVAFTQIWDFRETLAENRHFSTFSRLKACATMDEPYRNFKNPQGAVKSSIPTKTETNRSTLPAKKKLAKLIKLTNFRVL